MSCSIGDGNVSMVETMTGESDMEYTKLCDGGFLLLLQVNLKENNSRRCNGTTVWTETETKFIALENEVRNGFRRHRNDVGMVALWIGLVSELVLVLDQELLHPKDTKDSQYNSRYESRCVAIPNAKVVPA